MKYYWLLIIVVFMLVPSLSHSNNKMFKGNM